MIIVLKPWQCALCPGRLGAFVIPSAALNFSLLPGEVAMLAEKQLFFMVKTKPPNFPSPHPDTGEEVCAKAELTLGAAGDKSHSGLDLYPKDCVDVSFS